MHYLQFCLSWICTRSRRPLSPFQQGHAAFWRPQTCLFRLLEAIIAPCPTAPSSIFKASCAAPDPSSTSPPLTTARKGLLVLRTRDPLLRGPRPYSQLQRALFHRRELMHRFCGFRVQTSLGSSFCPVSTPSLRVYLTENPSFSCPAIF